MFTFRYELTGWGWAEAAIGNGTDEVPMAVSYLSNPLDEIDLLACFADDSPESRLDGYGRLETITFLDETAGWHFSLG